MANITKKTIIANMLVYGIARGVVEEVKPVEDSMVETTDATVFNEAMTALKNKEVEVHSGK